MGYRVHREGVKEAGWEKAGVTVGSCGVARVQVAGL